jgi:hypothetical protein
MSGIAGAVLGRFAGPPEIMRLRLIHRSREVTVEEFIGTFEEVEARAAQSMMDLLQEKLRDPEILGRYEAVQAIRVQHVTYGVHVGPLAILLSAIRGRRPAGLLAECREVLERIHHTHAVALGIFDPAEPWSQILSGEGSMFSSTAA